MLKAYKIEIKLTEEQKLKVNKTIGVCRFVYNLYLQKNIVIDEYKKAAYLIKDALENIKEIYLGGKDE